MWRPNLGVLSAGLSRDFGLDFEATASAAAGDWANFELRPTGIRREISFAVNIALGWRSITCRLIPGAFAGPLVAAMAHADYGGRQTFDQLAALCAVSKGTVALEVDGLPLDPDAAANWPPAWQRVALSMLKSPAVVNTEDYAANDHELSLWVRRFLNLALSLMPVEDLETAGAINPDSLPEGAKVRIEANRYERSRINRAACLELQGDSCIACDFNFGRTFGAPGEGFIHVHHVVPVSLLGPSYRINPANDLVPLCPNCHAMAHRFDPPASIADLQRMRRRGSVNLT